MITGKTPSTIVFEKLNLWLHTFGSGETVLGVCSSFKLKGLTWSDLRYRGHWLHTFGSSETVLGACSTFELKGLTWSDFR